MFKITPMYGMPNEQKKDVPIPVMKNPRKMMAMPEKSLILLQSFPDSFSFPTVQSFCCPEMFQPSSYAVLSQIMESFLFYCLTHPHIYGCFFPCLSQSKDSLGCLSYKCNPTLAKKGPAQRKRPNAAKIMATEVQSVRLWILLRKGRAKMKQIWLISFPENTQAVSCLTERVKKGWQFFSKPLIESQTVFQLWKGRQKDRRSPSLEQSPTMNRWLCRPVMKVFKTK